MITDAELIAKYDEYYTKNKDKWSSVDRNRLAYDALEKYVPVMAEVLDVGCGNGHTLDYFRQRQGQVKLYGIDLSQVAIDLCAKKMPEGNFQAAFLAEYDPGKKFQTIVCLGSAEHFTDLEGDLKKMKSLLSEGGVCYMEIPNNLAYDDGEHTFRQLGCGSRQFEWHLSKEEWEAKLIEAGFEIVKFYRRNKPQWEFCWVLA